MKLRPGRTMLALGGALIFTALLSFIVSSAAWLVPALIVAGIVLAVIDYRQLKVELQKVSIRRALPVVVSRAELFRSALKVSYSGSAAVDCDVRDILPDQAQPQIFQESCALANTAERELSGEFKISIRGKYKFGPVWVRMRTNVGFLELQRSFDCPGEVKVLPDSAASREALERSQAEMRLQGEMTRTRLRGEGMEFESLSEFRQGDDPRRIDWRSTARRQRLIVRRFQLEQHRDVMIVLDCGRLMGTAVGAGTKLDRSVDSAVLLSRVALEKGDRCGVALFDDKVMGYLPPLSGATAHKIVLETVYSVQSRWREANFAAMFATLQTRQIKRALIVVLSDITDADTSEQFRSALATLARKHVVIFAALRTPYLMQLLKAPVESYLDVSRKAVVARILQEREKAIHSLSRSGVHVLDVEPTELTVPLVNRYIELRERNLL